MSISARRLALAGALAAAALGTAAQSQVASRFVSVPSDVIGQANKLPRGLDNSPVTVVVMLSGESVASTARVADTSTI